MYTNIITGLYMPSNFIQLATGVAATNNEIIGAGITDNRAKTGEPGNSKFQKHDIFSFPSSMGLDEFRDWMRFAIVEFEGSTTSRTASEFLPIENTTAVNIQNSPTNKKLASAGRIKRKTDLKTTSTRRNKSFVVSTDIILPMPLTLSVNNTVGWDNAELGFVGGALNGGIDARNLKTSTSDLISNSKAGDVFGNIGTVITQKIANFALGFLGANGEAVNESANRFVLNPHAEILFKGTDFRKFTFSWKLTPRNESEVISVANIIKLFKFHAAPAIGTERNFITYPSEFIIQFIHNEETVGAQVNSFLPRIAQSVCTDITANYTSVGLWSAFKSGAPVEVELSLSFAETEIMTKQRINEGF